VPRSFLTPDWFYNIDEIPSSVTPKIIQIIWLKLKLVRFPLNAYIPKHFFRFGQIKLTSWNETKCITPELFALFGNLMYTIPTSQRRR
jgi:hypothetical protein